jgi:hypothetical protein
VLFGIETSRRNTANLGFAVVISFLAELSVLFRFWKVSRHCFRQNRGGAYSLVPIGLSVSQRMQCSGRQVSLTGPGRQERRKVTQVRVTSLTLAGQSSNTSHVTFGYELK